MFCKFFLFFERFISKIDSYEEREFIKNLIPRYASGNVLAQQGKFIISPEIEKRKEKILSYKFS